MDPTISPRDDETYPYGTDDGRLFRTLEGAEAYAAGWAAYRAVLAVVPTDQAGNWLIPSPMSREAYEDWAGRAGIEPWSDEAIRHNAYGIHYYQPQEITRETGLHVLRLGLAGRRLAQLEWDDRRRAQAAAAPADEAPCDVCGVHVARVLLMASSSVGEVCPSCYDDVEGD